MEAIPFLTLLLIIGVMWWLRTKFPENTDTARTIKQGSGILPSFIDDVREYATFKDLPSAGSVGVIYYVSRSHQLYRWTGLQYAEMVGYPQERPEDYTCPKEEATFLVLEDKLRYPRSFYCADFEKAWKCWELLTRGVDVGMQESCVTISMIKLRTEIRALPEDVPGQNNWDFPPG